MISAPEPQGGKTPIVVHLNGQHSSLHWHYLIGLPRMLTARGISSLLFDHPGVGYARYELGLMVRPDTETYVRAAIDFLETDCESVDVSRLGAIGGSLGGYRVSRAAAFEPRIIASVAWGAHYDMYDSVRTDWPSVAAKLPDDAPLTAEEQAVVDGLLYWSGTHSVRDLDAAIRSLALDGVMEKVRSALLVMHGAKDAQLPSWHAERTAREATNASVADLVLFDQPLGGVQHCNWDNPPNAMAYMCDWLRERLDHA